MTKNKYKVITNIKLANAIEFLTGQSPKLFPNRNYNKETMTNKDRFVFSFVVDEDFTKAFNLLLEAQKELKQRPIEEEVVVVE